MQENSQTVQVNGVNKGRHGAGFVGFIPRSHLVERDDLKR